MYAKPLRMFAGALNYEYFPCDELHLNLYYAIMFVSFVIYYSLIFAGSWVNNFVE